MTFYTLITFLFGLMMWILGRVVERLRLFEYLVGRPYQSCWQAAEGLARGDHTRSGGLFTWFKPFKTELRARDDLDEAVAKVVWSGHGFDFKYPGPTIPPEWIEPPVGEPEPVYSLRTPQEPPRESQSSSPSP